MSEFTSVLLVESEDHFQMVSSNLYHEEVGACCDTVAELMPGMRCHHVFESAIAATNYTMSFADSMFVTACKCMCNCGGQTNAITGLCEFCAAGCHAIQGNTFIANPLAIAA
jgi:hypothetical protein